MPLDPLVSQNYAHALLNVVNKEQMPLEDAKTEAASLKKLLIHEPRLFIFLTGPHFREEEKEKFVETVFKGKLEDIFYRFLLLILRRDRVDHLHEILDEFYDMVEEAQGLTMGTVTTALSLSEEEQNNFRDKLEHYCNVKFDLTFKVDPKLIGGVKVQYKDKLMDTTISTFLDELRQRLAATRLGT